jgi:S-formylglutathione hydrolase FrmB
MEGHQAPRLLRLLIAGALTLLVAMGATTAGARANALKTVTIPDKAGELPQQWLNYYKGVPRANILLPDGYSPRKRYPLLVLLSGLNGDYDSYASAGDLSVFNGFPGIVVMPESADGWYTDWWNNGERGGPAWESYELNEVLPYVLSHYKILSGRRFHAIAGISMGGLGATYLGGRLPGFFGSVASLSGFVDLSYFAPLVADAMGLLASAPQNGDSDPDPVDGPPNAFYAAGHNPSDLTMNLRQSRVFVSTGTGDPSSAELGVLTVGNLWGYPANWAAEGGIIHPMSVLYHQALLDAGVHVSWEVQNGGHDDPHFRQELRALLAWGLFKPVVTDPSSWTNDTVATDGQLWDIRYRFAHPPNAVVRFRREGTMLSISAAGSAATITTANGCTVETTTPAVITVPARNCARTAKRSSGTA